VRDVTATPPTRRTAAPQRSGLTDSPSSRAADDIPKTGTRSEKGATAEASYVRSRKPQTPKPKTVVTQAT
jgi:hypothetical protein